MRLPTASLLVFLLLLLGSSAWPAPSAFRAARLATVPDDVLVLPPVRFNPQGTSVAYAASRRKKAMMMTGNKHSAEFERVGPPLWLSGWNEWVYEASDGKAEFVMRGDRKGRSYERVRGLVASPKGNEIAYVACRGGHEMVVVGDQEGEEFDLISKDALVWSAGGETVAYVANRGKAQFVVVGHEARGPYKLVGTPAWSLDGGTIAYPLWEETASGIRVCVMCGKEKGPFFDNVYDPVFSPSGALAYVAVEGGKEFVMLGGKHLAAYPSVGHLVFGVDGKHLAYACGPGNVLANGGRHFTAIVVNGVLQIQYDSVSTPVFGPTGTVAYIATQGGKQRVVCGTEVGPPFDVVERLQISANDRPIYAAREGDKWFLVRGQKYGPNYFSAIEQLMLSPDAFHYAYLAADLVRRKWLFYGHETSEVLSEIYWPPTFSRDNQEIGFGARKGRELWWKSLRL